MNNAFLYKFFTRKKIIIFLIFSLALLIINIYDQKKVQEKVSTFFLKKVREKLGNEISIKHISFNFFEKELIFYDVKIRDHHHFSFIHLSQCKISINNLFRFIFINSRYLNIKNLIIDNSSFFIRKYFKEKENNILFFIRNIFLNQESNKMNIKIITCSKLRINKSHLIYIDSKKKFNHFFSSYIKNIQIKNRKIKASIFSFQSQEFINKKKFCIKNLFCNLTYDYPAKLEIRDFFIKTSNSFLKGSFSIFNDDKYEYEKNKEFFSKKSIRCEIFKGSKLGPDLGIFFSKKWSSNFRLFIQGNINGKFNGLNKRLFLSNIFIKDLQENRLFAKSIYISLNQEWKEIKFFKSFIQFYPHQISQIIPYNFHSKLNFIKEVNLNLKKWIYKGNLIFREKIGEGKKSLKIEGIIQNHFLAAKVSTYINFMSHNHDVKYVSKITIEKKYLLFLFKVLFKDKKKSFFLIPSGIPLFINKYLLSDFWIFINLKGNLSKFFLNLFLSHSGYQINLKGKIHSHFNKIYLRIDDYKNRVHKGIKVMLINNQKFKKISINIYDMIIGQIYGHFKWEHLLTIIPKDIFELKNSCKKEIEYVNFNFLIKKSFFNFIKQKKDRNTFSDIRISGKKEKNVFKTIFFTESVQWNGIYFEKLFIIVNSSSFRKWIKIDTEKITYKDFFSKKINVSILSLENFWMINSKFLLKLKKQKYKEQILNFICKNKKNLFIFFPLLSKLSINGYDWKINNNLGIIKIDLIKRRYTIKNIILSSEKQEIIVNADFIEKKEKTFQFYFKDVQLKKIIFKNNIDGFLNGFFSYKRKYNQIEPNLHVKISDFSIGKKILGNFYVHSFHKDKNYKINGVLKKNTHDILKINGNINNESKNQSILDLNINVKNLKMDNFSFFWKKMNSEARGFLTGKIKIFGNIDNPHYFGRLELKKFGIKINSINTDYEITSKSYVNIVSESCISLSSSYFKDTKYNTQGYINGCFLHKNFIKWNFELSINTKNLLVLDTYGERDRFLFGKILTHGKIQITKKENKVHVSMKNGKILSSSHLYINPKGQKFQNQKNQNRNHKGDNDFLLIDIKTNVKRNTKVSIFLDENLENFIELKGEGSLSLRKTYKKNVETSGKYFVIDGLYHFSIREKIPILKLEKEFKIKPGGFITWKNNFDQSNINLIAYETKSVSKISEYINFTESEKPHKGMIFAELRINIYGKIQKPNINMEILFPKSNEETQKKLFSKLNSFEEKTIQFLSILILGKFFLKNETIKNFLYFSVLEFFLKKLKKILLDSYINQSLNFNFFQKKETFNYFFSLYHKNKNLSNDKNIRLLIEKQEPISSKESFVSWYF
ncbi:translocation/assembly module TamB domain-containing protein [Blattabacterium cuenoti]|uniref:translocation/assembly module TamB domain-containing protein n=1 Tax=Blattabacterium cuenoti TaxID=1653831 RepID=UPI00163C58B1|nr:translocation/assembly module TamB domain-containing protein [Blattabacterium cuenoti]